MKTCPILVSFALTCAAAHAQFTYSIDDGEASVTEFDCGGSEAIIPDTFMGLRVTSIGNAAFSGCSNLTRVIIPNSVTRIEPVAFWGCSGLPSVTIPDSVTSIGPYAFIECTSLTAIEVDASNTEYSSLNGVLFNKNQDTLIHYPAGKVGGYIIPHGVTSIGDAAFSECKRLSSVTIPDSVTRIESNAFYGCTGLTTVRIPDNVASIGQYAFRYCTGLTEITIPRSVTTITRFAFDGCTSMTAIEVDTANPEFSSLEGVLFNKNQDTLVQFPVGRAGRYLIPNSVTRIGNWAFFGCEGLSDVTIPYSVTGIGWNVFEGCTSLTRVTIGQSVTTIGFGAFRYCTNLTRVIIPSSLTSMRQGLFWNCPNLTGVYFEGNAPEFSSENGGAFGDIVDSRSAAILYHRSEATGWGQRNGDRPTALWIDPPAYEEWIQGTRLPPDSTQSDDPDRDRMTNFQEMLAGTDPMDSNSTLAMERKPRLEDLTDEDKAQIESDQHALYVRTVPGKTYAVQWAASPTGPWNVETAVTATTTQTRFVFPFTIEPGRGERIRPAFFRAILAQ